MSDRPTASALLTDLYEITMAQAYLAEGMTDTAVFEAFFRKLPAGRNYVVAAGLADVVAFLEGLRFYPEDIDYLRTLGPFADAFLDELGALRFTGDLWAVPEGTVVFANEPVVQIIAPIVEAQIVETFVLNQIHLQSVLASKAARVVEAAAGRPVVDFGARRAHGSDAAHKLARAAYLAGAAGTSNLFAARLYDIPAFGTMAHSFVQAFDDEREAFAAFACLYRGTTLLVDTYDTLRGVDRVIELAKRVGERFDVRAIRLDSGDLAALSRAARDRLDEAGLDGVQIFASSGLDEHAIAALLARGSPIDGFGIGTELSVARDAPSLETAYKLVEYAGRARTKLSIDKMIHPGRKQVFRRAEAGTLAGDTIGAYDEDLDGERLLVPIMEAGRRRPGIDLSLAAARRRARAQLDALPLELRALDQSKRAFPVGISDRVMSALESLRRAYEAP